MTKYAKGSDGHKANHLHNGKTQTLAVGVASVESAPLGASTEIIRIVSDIDCHYIIGEPAQTALSTSAYLPADIVEYVGVEPGDTLAVIQNAATGVLWITECG